MRDLTGRLARAVRRALTRDERGAIGVLVAVVLGGGVLLGMGALVIDVGQLYSERAELQNGADAAAVAVSQTCVTGTCVPSRAVRYAGANARDGVSAVTLVCGSGPGLPSCPAGTGTAVDCPAAPAAGTRYVDVHTATLTTGGSTLLPPVFSRSLAGNSDYRGSTVLACARVRWGAPAAATTAALTISACEWDQATGQGTVFAAAPPYPPATPPAPSLDRVLKVHTTLGLGCATEPAGSDAPGLFGWTADATGTCSVTVSGLTYLGNSGVAPGKSCETALATARTNRTLIFIPVYTTVIGTGSTGIYTLKGFAAFVVTGYHLSGVVAPDWLNPANDCKGSDKCVNGYFTRGLIPATGLLGGPDLGAAIAVLAG